MDRHNLVIDIGHLSVGMKRSIWKQSVAPSIRPSPAAQSGWHASSFIIIDPSPPVPNTNRGLDSPSESGKFHPLRSDDDRTRSVSNNSLRSSTGRTFM